MACNFDHLKACLQKKVRKNWLKSHVNKLSSSVFLMADTQDACPPKQPLLSPLRELCTLGKLAEKTPDSHFPHWEGRSEKKILSDFTPHSSESHCHLLQKQVKCAGVEMNRTVGSGKENLESFFFY